MQSGDAFVEEVRGCFDVGSSLLAIVRGFRCGTRCRHKACRACGASARPTIGSSNAHRGRLARLSSRGRRPRALPPVRAVAFRRRSPVPASPDRRTRAARARDRAKSAVRCDARVSLQLVQLRSRTPASVRTRRLSHGAPCGRADRCVSRLRRRNRRDDRCVERGACRRDHRSVAVQPRQAPRARA